MSSAIYDRIYRYVVDVACTQPMHVGSADGKREDILRHPSTGKPFVQASGIAGALADYVQKANGYEVRRQLFGNSGETNGMEGKSRVAVLDGVFLKEKARLEMRTRCSLNKALGSVDEKRLMGSELSSGAVQTAEYIGTGSQFRFAILVYGNGFEQIEDAIAAIHAGKIRFGGQNTSGFGRLSVLGAVKSSYDMTNEAERKSWAKLTDFYEKSGADLTSQIKDRKSSLEDSDYVIHIQAKLDAALLIKANMTDADRVQKSLGNVDKMPNFMNICNANKEYIIPGTSLKGVFRGRIETIADYLGIPNGQIEQIFEQRSKILFEDAVIREERSIQQKRIHLNKISGAVKYQELFSECVAGGEADITIHVDTARLSGAQPSGIGPKACIALLLYAVRDLAVGAASLGSGASIGRGFLTVGRVTIQQNGADKADFSLKAGEDVGDAFVAQCLEELNAVQ